MSDDSSAISAAHRGGEKALVALAAIGVSALAVVAGAGALFVKHAERPHDSPAWQIGSLPFAALLLAIAVLPLIPATTAWWHHNRNKLVVALAAAFATLAFIAWHGGVGVAAQSAEHALLAEYVPFMTLLLTLYVITGGIALTGDLIAKPATNAGFLAAGAVLANVLGTTGASMLLIRPLLATNVERRYKTHTIIFFIFIVSNCGGLLLPIGDPPLFLGYLRGVPFLWTLNLWTAWLPVCGALIVIYLAFDARMWKREDPATVIADRLRREPLRLTGAINIIWLALALVCVATIETGKPLPLVGKPTPPFLREGIMLALCGLSLATTPRIAREQNRFSFGAILEVAALFLGIFVAMQVPLQALTVHGAELGLHSPTQFFWATGMLSSFLDNAPTYLVFLQAAQTLPAEGATVPITDGAVSEPLLVAISLGAVLMGANTYIGNGPNFMVRAIAEEAGVRMPSFFGYMMWSVAILIPVFALVSFFVL